MTQRDLQRWSREVAEDPAAPSFVRLARAYRRQGRREAARDVVLRGLQRNPEHVAAHALLALLHIEQGDRQRAQDEWHTVLRLEPGNFHASRGLGFLALERGDLLEARRHLDAAGRSRPDDPAVGQALQMLAQREAAESPRARDPRRVFEPLGREAPFLGALLLDEQGLVVGGALRDTGGEAELLVGLLSAVVEEAVRSSRLMRLGRWRGLLLDCAGAAVNVAPLDEGSTVVLVARSDAPAGWVVRTASRAEELARRFLEVHR